MANPALRLVTPRHVNRKVALRRSTNASSRTREHLTEGEVDRLMAKIGRYGLRDRLLILIGYRHGLRAQEIANLEWSQVELGRNPVLHARRVETGRHAPDQGRRTTATASYEPVASAPSSPVPTLPPMAATRHGDETRIVSTSVYGKGRNNAEHLGARRISNRHRRAQHP
jgi:integrase